MAARLAATLGRRAPAGGPPLTAVFAYRSPTAFAGVLAALFRGHGYVPLNHTFPARRTSSMLARSGCRALIVDEASAAGLEEVLEGIETRLLIVLPDLEDVAELRSRLPRHDVVGAAELDDGAGFVPCSSDPSSPAYLLFTSGSTGTPKGVAVAHRNVAHFVDVMVGRYAVRCEDRFSQMFDLTFDLSAFDLFVAWEAGACVVCPAKEHAFMPYNYLQEANLSIWFSVPSVGVQMRRMRMLEPGMYPSLRLSLFCGEALPASMVEAWAAAAPSSVIENLYGPTEATIACCLYRWEGSRSVAESDRGIVPIGWPFAGMSALVVDEALREVAPGDAGELLVSGPQVSLGYWEDPAKTRAAFVAPPGRSEAHYRTGDRVRRPMNGGPLQYLGRVDQQIKIRGYRVELGEVEAAVRAAAGVETAIAVGWPRNDSGADGLVAFIGPTAVAPRAVKTSLKAALPPYMVPAQIRVVAAFPLNPNGKVDREALLATLAE
jgi:amino acid adenylation domain-containing protein